MLAGIKVRPAHISDCPDLGRVGVRANMSTFKGLVPDKCLDWTPEQSAHNWQRSFNENGDLKEDQFLLVAESEKDGLVGFALLEETRPTGSATPPIDPTYSHELIVLMVAPDVQGQGIGRLLVSHVASEAQRRGADHLLVRVLEINPNTAFYEHLGAVLLATHPHDWDGFMTTGRIYGWDNLPDLVRWQSHS